MIRPLALLLAASLTSGCASHYQITATPQPPPTPAQRVEAIYQPPRPPERCVSLSKRDQALMTRYLEAVALGAARHRDPSDHRRHDALSAKVVAEWGALRTGFRAALLADLEAGRLVAFRLRAQPLVRLALIHFEELEADAVARGHPTTRDHFSTSPQLDLPRESEVYRIQTDLRYDLPNLLKTQSLAEIVVDDRHTARLVEGLTAALFVAPDGLPARDEELAGELLHARQRLLRRLAAQRVDAAALRAEAARYEARRAQVAANEAETHRDRALDAALDASVAAEGVDTTRGAAQPRRERRVR